MPNHSVTHYSLALLLAATLALAAAVPCQAATLTQRDWMIALVDALGWTFGLPDEPQDPDYFNILGGNRTFRFEAEDIYARDEDNVSLMSFTNFGAFSGSGWLHSGREPSLVHLRFTLPHAGDYRLSAKLRGSGHSITVGGKTTTAEADHDFTEVSIGRFRLPAGPQEIRVTLPVGGSIDYISLAAPNLAPIAPTAGWRPDEALTWNDIHATLLQLLGLAELFPPEGDALVFEAEKLKQDEAEVVATPYLGTPSGGQWLRAGAHPAKIRLPLTLPGSGYYDLTVRAMGDPLQITVGDHLMLEFDAGAWLTDNHIKPLALTNRSSIVLEVPPGGGLDRISLQRRKVDMTRVARLLGLSPSAVPVASDLDSLTRQLTAFGIER